MAQKIELAQMSDTMTEGAVVAWLKEEGDAVRQGDPIAEIETDKATMEIEAPQDGVLLKRLVEVGVTVPCGTVLALVGAAGESVPEAKPVGAASHPLPTPAAPKPAVSEEAALPSPAQTRVSSSPSARKLARIERIDLAGLAGTGPGGRIVRRDVEAAAGRVAPPPPPSGLQGGGQILPISRLRRKMIERLVVTHQSVPTFSISRRIRMDAATALRRAFGATPSLGGGIGYTELLVKAAASAMQAVPRMNGRFTDEGIRVLGDVNIGVAVGLEDGVVVPVIRRCQTLDLRATRDEFRRLTDRAKNGTLLADDLGNSTFTISSLGMYGVERFSAILNAPDAAILAVGAVAPEPVADGGKVAVAEMMSVTLTVDHRVADGVLAARWLQAFAGLVENPVGLVVEVG